MLSNGTERPLLDLIDCGIYVVDKDLRLLTTNRAGAEVLEAPHDELVGRPLIDAAGAVGRSVAEALSDVVRSRVPRTLTGVWGPSKRWSIIRVKPYRDGLVVVVDPEVTPESRLSDALAASLRDGLLIVDGRGRVDRVNDRFLDMVGHSRDDVAGMEAPYPWWPGSDAPWDRLLLATLNGEPEREHEVEFRRADGLSFPVGLTLAPISREDPSQGFVATVRDLSAEHAASAELRVLTEELEFVSSHARDAISLHDADGRFQFVSEAARGLWGLPPGELLGRSLGDVATAAGRDALFEVVGDAASGSEYDETVVYEAEGPDGSVITIETSIRGVYEDGQLIALACVSRDATERVAEAQATADLARRSQAKAAEQAALRRVAMTVASDVEPDVAFELVAREVADLLGVDVGVVFRFGESGAVAVGVHGVSGGLAPVFPLSGDTALARVHASGRAARVEDFAALGSFLGVEVATGAAAPVRLGGNLWGAVLAARNGNDPLPPGSIMRLDRFAEMVALAVSAADARARLAAQATTDPLTSLANHRVFHERLREEVARAARHGRSLALVVLDIDHFKAYNDLYGHQAGDRALAEVSRRLRAVARSEDLVARIGGEEFGWILPETDGPAALDAVERARRLVAGSPIGDKHLTISGGICDLARATDADGLFRLADGALYWAKARGRDQACLYSPEKIEILSVEERAEALERTRALVALRSLARAVDAKDAGTQVHSERVADLASRLALQLGWSVARAEEIRDAGLLHDVGKIGVPDNIITKPGELTSDEYDVMKRHPGIGAQIAADALTEEQCSWIRHHHERVDGAGYPDGLSGDDIPEGALILGVADAWDVMTYVRGYGPRRTPQEVVEECRRSAGTQFSTDVVAALIELDPAHPEAAGAVVPR